MPRALNDKVVIWVSCSKPMLVRNPCLAARRRKQWQNTRPPRRSKNSLLPQQLAATARR